MSLTIGNLWCLGAWIRRPKAVAIALLILGIGLAVFVLLADARVARAGRGRCYADAASVPKRSVGVVLGTGKFVNGRENRMYRYRIQAAAALFRAGKVEYLLVSGDKSRPDYDEPTAMKEDLVREGVPAERIYRDFAGFRTLDSVVRTSRIFQQREFTIISQRFHNERALYLAGHHGLNAVAFDAPDVSLRAGFKTKVREKFARAKAVLDVLLGVKPKFLGPAIEIGTSPAN